MTLHDRQQVLRGGPPLAEARGLLLLLHGRGATAEDIYSLGEQAAEGVPEMALVAPQASGNAWYPQRFLAAYARNEPQLTSALGVVANLLAEASESRIRYDKIILVGFSQGACLALEFAARHVRRYGGIVGLSGAVIGPPGGPRKLSGNFSGTPVYLGCDEFDAHIPLSSVEESAKIFEALGAQVTKSIFSGLGHSVNAEEMEALKGIVQKVVT